MYFSHKHKQKKRPHRRRAVAVVGGRANKARTIFHVRVRFLLAVEVFPRANRWRFKVAVFPVLLWWRQNGIEPEMDTAFVFVL